MVTHQLQVQCRPVKVRRSETDVLPIVVVVVAVAVAAKIDMHYANKILKEVESYKTKTLFTILITY